MGLEVEESEHLRSLRSGFLPDGLGSGDTADGYDGSREGMRRALESFLAKNGMPQEELLRPPLRESGNCRTYCPLCLAQFVLAEGECPDCGEVQLKTFPLGSESVPGDRP